jgi:hypothetical protein
MVRQSVIEMIGLRNIKVGITLSRKRSHINLYCIPMAFYILLFFNASHSHAQDKKSPWSIGLNLGVSDQDGIIFDNQNYQHSTTYFKIQVDREFWVSNKQHLSLLLEPSIYLVSHQLLNKFYITPDQPDFRQQQKLFTQSRSYEEYVLNLGIKYSYDILPKTQVYGLLSVGPMIATEPTERQRQGFAFSDILGIGIQYQWNRWSMDLRLTLRHVSSADLTTPNDGHNNSGIETGLSYNL